MTPSRLLIGEVSLTRRGSLMVLATCCRLGRAFTKSATRASFALLNGAVTCSNGSERVFMTAIPEHGQRQADSPQGLPRRVRPRVIATPRAAKETAQMHVHRMVLEAFHGPMPSPASECLPRSTTIRDRQPRWRTCAWGTKAEQRRRPMARTRPHQRGEAPHDAKLTAFQVFMLRERPKYRGLISDIAAEFGISRVHASRIRSGTYWGWL